MRAGFKVSLSLLISLVLFSGFAFLAYSGLFEFLESRFYHPRIEKYYQNQAALLSDKIGQYHNRNIERYGSLLTAPYVPRIFLSEQLSEDIGQRERDFGRLEEELPDFLFSRFIDPEGREIHFSTLESDVKESSAARIAYFFLNQVEEKDVEPFIRGPDDEPVLHLTDEGKRFVYSFPIKDGFDVYKGTALFYVAVRGLYQDLLKSPDYNYGSPLAIGDQGFIVNFPEESLAILSGEVRTIWGQERQEDVFSSPITATLDGVSYVLFTATDLRYGRLGLVLPSSRFQIQFSLQVILLASLFLTVFLIVFLFFNLRQDPLVVLSERIKRFQIDFLMEFMESKEMLDWQKWKREFATKTPVLKKRIKSGIGRVGKDREKEVDSLIDRSWEEIITLLGIDQPTLAEPRYDFGNIEQMLQRLIEKGTSRPAESVQGSAGTVTTGIAPPPKEGEIDAAAEEAAAVEAVEVEELEEAEAVEAEELEELEEVEAAPEEAVEVEELEEGEAVEAAASETAPAEAEELEELEEAGEEAELTREAMEVLDEAKVVARLEEPPAKPEEAAEAEELEAVETAPAEAAPVEAEELEELESVDGEPTQLSIAETGVAPEGVGQEEAEEAAPRELEAVEEIEELVGAEDVGELEAVGDEKEPEEEEGITEAALAEDGAELEELEVVEEIEELPPEPFEELDILPAIEEEVAEAMADEPLAEETGAEEAEAVESAKELQTEKDGNFVRLSLEDLREKVTQHESIVVEQGIYRVRGDLYRRPVAGAKGGLKALADSVMKDSVSRGSFQETITIPLVQDGFDYDAYLQQFGAKQEETTLFKSLIEISKRVNAIAVALLAEKNDGFWPDMTLGLNEKSVGGFHFFTDELFVKQYFSRSDTLVINKAADRIEELVSKFSKDDIKYIKRAIFFPAIHGHTRSLLFFAFSRELPLDIDAILRNMNATVG
jgi:hypothetical protein